MTLKPIQNDYCKEKGTNLRGIILLNMAFQGVIFLQSIKNVRF